MKANVVILRFLIALGMASIGWYLSWWVEHGALTNLLLLPLFVGMVVYVITQALFPWYIFLQAGKREKGSREAGPEWTVERKRTVDVFLPTFREPIELIEKTIGAVMAIRYPHKTYVIDDGNNDNVRNAALSAGAEYIRRSANQHNKAGNINNALKKSSGELVVTFDIDHVPDSDFLAHVIPCFDDPRVGVVQVALDHYNQRESFVAAASSTMSDEFFAATMRGMDRLGCAMVFGSNAVYRRSTLLSMGGYKLGLAEDLNTSIHLHAAGWKSVYIPEILAKGLAPSDLNAFFKQQYKWARGVFDILVNQGPSLIKCLNVRQRICYTTRMTYYLAGPVIAFHILAAILAPLALENLHPVGTYVMKSIPFLLTYAAVQAYAYRLYALKPGNTRGALRGPLLVLASWPVYSLALWRAMVRKEPKFIATPKSSTGRVRTKYIVPQSVAVFLLLSALLGHIFTSPSIAWGYVVMVSLLILVHSGLMPATSPRGEVARGTVRETMAVADSKS